MIECKVHKYRSRLVDAIVNRVLPREVAQAVMIQTTIVSRSLVTEVGKELPRAGPVVFVLFKGEQDP